MKKNDWILAAAVFLIAAVFAALHILSPDGKNARVEVNINGELYGSYLLDEEQTIDINGTNQVVIKNGEADMVWADCPDKLCVHQKAISRNGESIICLPNKIVVTIVNGDEGELDAVTN